MHNVFVSYDRFRDIANRLHGVVRNNGSRYEAILCPLRGGFYLSYFMSRKLDIPLFYIEIASYSGSGRQDCRVGMRQELAGGHYLLCDDIYDTGSTIRKIHELYPHVSFDVACVVSKVTDAGIHYGMLVDPTQWVDFFWETM